MSLADSPEQHLLPESGRPLPAGESSQLSAADAFQFPVWHRETLDERWEAYRKGRHEGISLQELERRLGT